MAAQNVQPRLSSDRKMRLHKLPMISPADASAKFSFIAGRCFPADCQARPGKCPARQADISTLAYEQVVCQHSIERYVEVFKIAKADTPVLSSNTSAALLACLTRPCMSLLMRSRSGTPALSKKSMIRSISLPRISWSRRAQTCKPSTSMRAFQLTTEKPILVMTCTMESPAKAALWLAWQP